MAAMLKTGVFVLCAGESVRFDGTQPKQLLEFNGIPILHRTLEKTLARGFVDTVIVTHDRRLVIENASSFDPTPRRGSTCESLLSTGHLWRGFERVVVLLGDVYYTENALDKILYVEKDFCVYSDRQDIFGMSFSAASAPGIKVAIRSVLDDPNGPHNHGRLWELYRSWHRLPINCGLPLEETRGATFEPIGDATQDFDCMADYIDFDRGISKNQIYRRAAA